ncbi:MAG: dihydrofolate reductase family protein [Kineosporiaceae bacterium]
MRSLVYYVATSVDGFIADREGGVGAFPVDRGTLAALFDRYPETCPAHLRDALGVNGEAQRFDTVIMGARTHEPALEAGLTSAYPHLRQYIATHRELPPDPTVTTVAGDVGAVVRDLRSLPGRDIWLCGGADLAGQLIDEIDEIQLKVNPVVLGDGVPLFAGRGRPHGLTHHSAEVLPGGVVLTTYRRPRPATPADA